MWAGGVLFYYRRNARQCDRQTFSCAKGLFTGAVRDFVRVENFFGIFNMADSFLVVGVILALLAIVFFDSDSLLAMLLTELKKAKDGVQTSPSDDVIREDDADDAQTNEPIRIQPQDEAEQQDENDKSNG